MAKKIKCDQLHTLVNQLIMLGANLATTVLGGLLGPEMAGLSLEVRTAMTELEDINKRLIWDDLVEKGEYIKIGHRIADLRKIVQKGKEKLGKAHWLAPSLPVDTRVTETQTLRTVFWGQSVMFYAGFLGPTIYNSLKPGHDLKNQFIVPGIAHGTICSDFEGDFVDNNAANRDNLSFRISSIFESARQQRQTMFKGLYKGLVTEPGQSSATAMWLKTRDWIGPRSVLEDMKDISAMEE